MDHSHLNKASWRNKEKFPDEWDERLVKGALTIWRDNVPDDIRIDIMHRANTLLESGVDILSAMKTISWLDMVIHSTISTLHALCKDFDNGGRSLIDQEQRDILADKAASMLNSYCGYIESTVFDMTLGALAETLRTSDMDIDDNA